MRKKSVIMTIVSAIIIVSITGNINGNPSISANVLISLALSFLGLPSAWLSIRNIDKVDVIS